MKYIKHTLENGNIINIPEEFVALDNVSGDPLHYRVELVNYNYKFTNDWVFKVTHIDGEVPIEYATDSKWIIYFPPEVLINKKIKPYSMKKFKTMRTFL